MNARIVPRTFLHSLAYTALLTVLTLVSLQWLFAEDWESLIEDLRSDDVPGNACMSFKLLLELKENPPIQLLEAELRGDDPQSRSIAAILLSRYKGAALPEEDKAFFTRLLVENLRSDSVCFNAGEAASQLSHLIRSGDLPDMREKLESLLDDPGHQIGQYAVHLLVYDVYKSQSEWPEALMRYLVKGLRGDSIEANASTSFRLFFSLKENYPIQLLAAELHGDDPQSRLLAAILLSLYKDESTSPERSEILLKQLLDDGVYDNAISAYLALARSGAENTRRLLEEFKPFDWQQAALIQCIASFHGVEWSTSDDAIREQWLEKASKPYNTHWPSQEHRFVMAALYLDPQRERFLQGEEVPEALERMFRAGRGVKGAINRMKWVAGWFPILDPDPPMQDYSYRSRTFMFSMR